MNNQSLNRHRWLTGTALLGLAVAGTLPARAQTTAPADTGALTEIVVTAERRSTDVQKTPIAITTVTGEALAQQGTVNLQNAIALIPSVQVQQTNFGATFYIRGIGTRGTDGPSPVAVNIDGVYQERAEVTNSAFADVNRVEVLRGPQGTLYGRNANGGSVNVITNGPVLGRVEGAGTLQYGNYNTLKTEGVINVPLGDKVAVRGVFSSYSHDGYLSNGLDDADEKYGRVKVLAQPTDDVRVLLEADLQKDGGKGAGNVRLPVDSRSNPWEGDDYSSMYAIPTGDALYCNPHCTASYDMQNVDVHGQVDWDAKFANLTLLAAHQDFEKTYVQPFSGTYERYHLPLIQNSVEFRLASEDDSRLKWVAGFYYLNQDDSGAKKTNYTFDSVENVVHGTVDSKAVFGQATYPVTDRLRVTAGLRYTNDTLEETDESGTQTATTVASPMKATFAKTTYKVGVEYDLAAANMLYAQVSTGYKAGGLSTFTGNYGPEEITAYEVGSKNRFLNDRLQINLAAYYYEYTGYQLSYYHYVNDTPEFFTSNVPGTTKVYGWEAEGSYMLTPDDRVDFSVNNGYSSFGNATVLLSCGADICATALGGRELPRNPRWTGTAAYEHTFNLNDGARVTAGVNMQAKSSYYIDLLRFSYSEADPYSIWNGKITYEAPNGQWSISAYVNNIGNTPVVQQANTAGSVNVYSVIGDPRTYGVVLHAKF
ncbi:TonB-dependent receptor domain-containing protein [Nitrospirillum iridis]|uniref:Iron complex outermembrane receptor protein n=1 Tax=Nitrospirillum iridis TaxID=765888 RepID=A0A7X0EBR3_9PROT|nr:iron complex outermembrane receptor protein [Nitrospirillum iridis]